ncbi:PKD domain-containing protein [Candidatus Saccharibacteria bacterium]|jgi:hypothetical protein|nr:PKD domain-containing protein [Candidatus Saccharibacteria bacterium]HPR09168.1 hypothetical protein [Candidatus Saccharibacteria bacterium]
MSAIHQFKFIRQCIIATFLAVLLLLPATVHAIGSPDPQQSGAAGLTGRISSPPPTRGATISVPTGGTVTGSQITVSGLCPNGLLVKVFSNNIFVGSAQCDRGSFSLQIDLFSGSNDIIARVYDALDQAGPDSNTVTVVFNDGQYSEFRQRVSLTSAIAKLGAPVGTQLSWPIIISGGTGPYAISVDWGDGSAADLKSVAFAGTFSLTHTYKSAGIYRVVVKATDSKGTIAFLQLVGVGSGPVTQGSSTNSGKSSSGSNGGVIIRYIWWPMILLVPIIFLMFLVGRKYERDAIRRQIERQTEMYSQEIQR